jgi:hypothetical protein
LRDCARKPHSSRVQLTIELMSPNPEATPDSHMLPANVDDPRFSGPTKPETDREWTDADAVLAEATMPLDDAEMIIASELCRELWFVWLILELVTAPIRCLMRLLQR